MYIFRETLTCIKLFFKSWFTRKVVCLCVPCTIIFMFIVGFCFITTFTSISFTAFHLFHLVWDLMTMLLWHILALFFWVVAAYFPGRWNTTRLQEHLIIVAYSFRNRPAMLSIDILLDLLWLRPLLQFAHLFVFIMAVLLFARNRYLFG